MSKKKSIWHKIFVVLGGIHHLVALAVGGVVAYIFFNVFNMGVQGAAIGFVLGFGMTIGALSFDL